MCGKRSGSDTSMLSSLIFRNLQDVRVDQLSTLLLMPSFLLSSLTDFMEALLPASRDAKKTH